MIKEGTFVRPINVTAMTRKRNGKVTHNGTRITFLKDEEQIGTTLYVGGDNDGVQISRNPFPGSKETVVNGLMRSEKNEKRKHGNVANALPIQTYLNLGDTVTISGQYMMYRTKDGYRLEFDKPAEKKPEIPYPEVSNAKMSRVGKNGIHLSTEFYDRLLDGREKSTVMFVIEESYTPYCFIKVTCIPKEQAESIAHGVPGDVRKMIAGKDMPTLTRKIVPGVNIRPSRYFQQEGRFTDGDYLYQEMVGDAVYIDVQPEFCDVCHRPIRRRTDKYITYDVCGRCEDTIHMVAPTVDNYGLQSTWAAMIKLMVSTKKEMNERGIK